MKLRSAPKKQASVLVSLMLLSTSLFGCSGNNGGTTQPTKEPSPSASATAAPAATATPAATAKPPENVTLKFWLYSDAGMETYKKSIATFESANPTIKIESEFLPYNGGPEKIQVAVAGNNAPDLLLDQTSRLMTFASQGKLAPLDDIITAEDKKDIPESVWGSGKFNGKQYVFTTSASSVAYMINKTLFKEAGAEHLLPQGPEKTWTYAQYKEALKAVTNAKNGVYGTAYYAANEQGDNITFGFMWGYGAETFNEDYSKVILNSPEGVKALETMVNLMDEGLVAPGSATMDGGAAIQLFNQKKIAVTLGGPANVKAVLKGIEEGSIKAPFDVDLVMIPGDKPKALTNIGGIAAFANSDKNKLEAAKKFITYWTSKENAKLTGQYSTTARQSVASELYKDDPYTQYSVNVLAKYAGRYGNHVVGFPEIRASFFPELQAAFSKAKTPKQALDDFADKANKVLEKYKK